MYISFLEVVSLKSRLAEQHHSAGWQRSAHYFIASSRGLSVTGEHGGVYDLADCVSILGPSTTSRFAGSDRAKRMILLGALTGALLLCAAFGVIGAYFHNASPLRSFVDYSAVLVVLGKLEVYVSLVLISRRTKYSNLNLHSRTLLTTVGFC